MDVDGALAEVEIDETFFELTDAADCALEDFLDEDALLGVHNLVIALFKFAIDLDILDVEHRVVRELFFKSPVFHILK